MVYENSNDRVKVQRKLLFSTFYNLCSTPPTHPPPLDPSQVKLVPNKEKVWFGVSCLLSMPALPPPRTQN